MLTELLRVSWVDRERWNTNDYTKSISLVVKLLHRVRKQGGLDLQLIIQLLTLMQGRWEEGKFLSLDEGKPCLEMIPLQLFAAALTLHGKLSQIEVGELYRLTWEQCFTRKPDSDRHGAPFADEYGRDTKEQLLVMLRQIMDDECHQKDFYAGELRNQETVDAIDALLEKRSSVRTTYVRKDPANKCPHCGHTKEAKA